MGDRIEVKYIPVGSPSHDGFYEVKNTAPGKVLGAMLAIDHLYDFKEMASVAAAKINYYRSGPSVPSAHALVYGFEPLHGVERLPTLVTGDLKVRCGVQQNDAEALSLSCTREYVGLGIQGETFGGCAKAKGGYPS